MNNSRFISQLVRLFLGSWYSVIAHSIVFALLLIVFKDFSLFTVIVSIEAIFIGIFILMGEYNEEEYRERKELMRHIRDRALVKEDVHLTQNVVDEIKLLKEQLKLAQTTLEEIKKSLK